MLFLVGSVVTAVIVATLIAHAAQLILVQLAANRKELTYKKAILAKKNCMDGEYISHPYFFCAFLLRI